ncbi:hypothetical protein K501DRAFT_267875 [Backusella circina FSU 941]|nr:hypothetical protein K501DRAFT_267875 [Backusella circina FSU 941]
MAVMKTILFATCSHCCNLWNLQVLIFPDIEFCRQKFKNSDSDIQEDIAGPNFLLLLSELRIVFLQIIDRFKNDELNTLVSTSIGEESVDIDKVDLIVCYDSQISPIKMLQRMGRTGHCVLLLTEAEEKKFNMAKETCGQLQHLIASENTIKYHHPIPSVIPPNYQPTMSRQNLTIGTYITFAKNIRRAKVDEQDYTIDGKMKEQTYKLTKSVALNDEDDIQFDDMGYICHNYCSRE